MAGIGQVFQGFGSIAAGDSARDAGNFAANQLEYNAGQARASSQREAAEARRQAELVASRVQALAGGGGADPTVVRLQSDIAARGEYDALAALYQGSDAAASLEGQARARRFQGEIDQRALQVQGTGQIISGAGQLFAGGFGGSGGDSGAVLSVGRTPRYGGAPTSILSAGPSLFDKYR